MTRPVEVCDRCLTDPRPPGTPCPCSDKSVATTDEAAALCAPELHLDLTDDALRALACGPAATR